MARYWFQRTERTCAELLYAELKAGRLRQGWGYAPDQDLKTISAVLAQGGQLTREQQQCWRGNRRLLPSEQDSVQPCDYIITPHLPRVGVWSLVRVVGGYRYEVHPDAQDFGHILEVQLLNPDQPIDPYCAHVRAGLRRTATTRSRMWNVDHLGDDVRALAKAVEGGADVSRREARSEKLARIHDAAAAALEAELRAKYHGSEFEDPVEALLGRIYGCDNVVKSAGSHEHGADFLCSLTDGLGVEHRIAVQVKMWEGTATWSQPLEQIRTAHASYDAIGAGVVMAMVEDFDDEFRANRDRLEAELSIPVHLIGTSEIVDLFMEHLPDLLVQAGPSSGQS